MKRVISLAGVLGMGFLVSGCITTGNDQLQGTVQYTYKVARKLDTDLSASVQQLRGTTTTLSQRLDDNAKNIQELEDSIRANQAALDKMKGQLDELTRVLYAKMGLTNTGASTGAPPSNIMIESASAAPMSAPPAGIATPETAVGGDPAAVYEAAQRSYIQQDYQNAAQQYDAYLRFPNTDHADYAQYWKAESYYQLAKKNQDSNLYQQSIVEFEKLRNDHPNSSKVPGALYDQAMAYLSLNQTESAIKLFDTLVAKFPSDANAERAQSELKKLKG